MWTSFATSGRTDALEDTVDYDAVYAAIAADMTLPERRQNLLETVATNIADTLLTSFPAVSRIDVRLMKPNLPWPGGLTHAAVELTRRRR